jgi:simple sugar transport system ATP-binding protein
MLHQDPMDFPTLTVLDNIILGSGWGFWKKGDKITAGLAEIARHLGFEFKPHATMGTLTVGERQQLEIVRLLALGVRVLILDEPTTAISQQQRGKLFDALRILASEGKTIALISHKLEEISEICTHVTVMAHGELKQTLTLPVATDQLITLMFGKELPRPESLQPPFPGQRLLVKDLAIANQYGRKSKIDLTLAPGEIVGLAGLEGSGQKEFLLALSGLLPGTRGMILLDGEALHGRGYFEFKRHHVVYLPANRMDMGLIPSMDLAEHLALQEQDSFGLKRIDWPHYEKRAVQLIEKLNIRGTVSTPLRSLSGGNQQRSLLALVPEKTELLLMEHPTRGLDIDSAQYIWQLLTARTQEGCSIIYSSADLDELVTYSHRIMVFFMGGIAGIVETAEADVMKLGEWIGGKGVSHAP